MSKKILSMNHYSFLILALAAIFLIFTASHLYSKNKNLTKENKLFNVVLIGAAGSGKGTQGDLIRDRLSLLKISAGDVLREYRKNPTAKHTAIINQTIDKGGLLPSEIVNEIIGEYISENVFKNPGKYKGVLYDGFPRQIAQLEFLDKFLIKHNNRINLVVYIDVPLDALVARLSGRYSCSECGAIYHKTNKPTKIDGVCDYCGSKHFTIRADDEDSSAIQKRFNAFTSETKAVLEEYNNRSIVFRVDGTQTPDQISKEIMSEIERLTK
jgi:adenylate kinase